jgi:glycosyl transferase family 87
VGVRTSLPLAAGTALVLLFFAAAVTAEPGLDYLIDPGGPIDALVRGDWKEFFANQPLMGSLSLFLRAPFVAPVFDSSVPTVYWVGALPCVLALLALAIWLLREMQRRGRSDAEQAMAGAVLILSPLSVRALHWGHPEELLGAALCVGAVIVASRGRGILAGLLLGCAIATKQWAVLAALPALVAAPAPSRVKLVGASAVVAVAFTAPMLIGNPDRFMLVQTAASSADPQYVLDGSGGSPLPGSHVTPNNVYLPFAFTHEADLGTIYLQSPVIGRLAHPLIILIALPLTLLLWRRRQGQPSVREALLLLALLFLARCVFDPMSLDYYHVPFLVALGAAGALGGVREARLALFATTGLAIAYATPTVSMYELSQYAVAKNAVYLAVTLPLLWTIGRELFGVQRAEVPEVAPRADLEPRLA